MKRICMVVQSYYLRDPRVRREAEALAEEGFEVDVITLRDKGEPTRETVAAVNIIRVSLMRKRMGILRYLFEYLCFFIFALFYLTYLHVKKDYDVIQIHTMPDFLVFSALIPKLMKAKVILDVHEPMPELFMSKYKLTRDNFVIKLIALQEKISFCFAEHLLTVHEPLRDLFVEQGMVSKEKIDVVLNVPDTKIFEEGKQRYSNDHESGFILIYTGTIAERYGLDIAIRGVNILKDKIPNLKLQIIGEGDHLIDLVRLVSNLGIDEQVRFHRSVSIIKIPDLLTKADIGISTHRQDAFWDIYFSTKLVEFIIMGLPVVVSRTKTIQYYFSDDMVFFFNPEDIQDFAEKVLSIYNNRSKARESVQIARDHIDKIGWKKEKKKYINLIKSFTAKY